MSAQDPAPPPPPWRSAKASSTPSSSTSSAPVADERLPGWIRPSTWYLTGFLIPSGTPPERYGAGSVVSTANDLVAWAGAVATRRLVTSESQREMWLDLAGDPASPLADGAGRIFTTGFGWWVTDDDGRFFVRHGGSVDGYVSTLDYYPDDDLAVVVLLNNEGSATALHEIVELVRRHR